MAPLTSASNPLLSSNKSTDGLHVLLHPLVLLTISDYITRHNVRGQKGPMVCAILGQQNGREVSLEHAFECKLELGDDGQSPVLSANWFEERLQQFKDVLKAPPLDLVGWFTVAPVSGPQDVHLPLHKSFLRYNESAVFLGFHTDLAREGPSNGGKLPLTIYERSYEATTSGGDAGANREGHVKGPSAAMDVDGLAIKFRELPYTVETGEAERIGVEFVARGGGNAGSVQREVKPQVQSDSKASDPKGKGKFKTKDTSIVKGTTADETAYLAPEEEELTSTLNARMNATRMLHSRVRLMQTYLSNLPESYLTDPSSAANPPIAGANSTASDPTKEINYPVIRSIQALLNRLPLVIPADKAAFEAEVLVEKNDVSLVALIGGMQKSVKDVKDMGKKYAVLEGALKAKGAAQTDGTNDLLSRFELDGSTW